MSNHKTEYVSVVFDNHNQRGGDPRQYTYFSHIHDLQLDDLVVVNVGPHALAKEDYKVARVVGTNPTPMEREKATKWIVDRVDLDVYRAVTKLTETEEPTITVRWVASAHVFNI